MVAYDTLMSVNRGGNGETPSLNIPRSKCFTQICMIGSLTGEVASQKVTGGVHKANST